jgi:hypothetical protein
LRDLDTAALSLAEISEKLITPEWSSKQVRAFLAAKQPKIKEAVTTIYELARPADDNYYQEIVARYPAVRRFFPALLRTIEFESNEAGKLCSKRLRSYGKWKNKKKQNQKKSQSPSMRRYRKKHNFLDKYRVIWGWPHGTCRGQPFSMYLILLLFLNTMPCGSQRDPHSMTNT